MIEILSVVNFVLAIVVIGYSLYKLAHHHKGKDNRAILMPVITGVAYMLLTVEWYTSNQEPIVGQLRDSIWMLFEFSMFTSIFLLLKERQD